jgi:hypothetical protein
MRTEVTARSKSWTIFARSNTGIVGSNPTRGMDVCVYSVFVLGSGLATGWSPVQRVLPTALWLRNWSETKRFKVALCSKWKQQKRNKKKMKKTKKRTVRFTYIIRREMTVGLTISLLNAKLHIYIFVIYLKALSINSDHIVCYCSAAQYLYSFSIRHVVTALCFGLFFGHHQVYIVFFCIHFSLVW